MTAAKMLRELSDDAAGCWLFGQWMSREQLAAEVERIKVVKKAQKALHVGKRAKGFE